MNGRSSRSRRERARILAYVRPAQYDFLKNFAKDLGSLRENCFGASYGVAIFAFARTASARGSRRSWFWVRRLSHLQQYQRIHGHDCEGSEMAQRAVSFAELGDKLRMNPLLVTSDTQFFKK